MSPATIEATVEQIIAQHQRAIAAQQFDVIGTVVQFVVDGKGTMDFGRQGPVFGNSKPQSFNAASELMMLGDWQGLPDAIEPLLDAKKRTKPCTKCLVKCDMCAGKGERPCNFTGCGGRGTLESSTKACGACKGKGLVKRDVVRTAIGTGKPVRAQEPAACEKCGGRGVVPDPKPCPACKGKKTVVCPGCDGTKRMSIGGLDARGRGSAARDAKTCPACHGQRHELRIVQQPWDRYVQGRLGSRLVFGPISAIVFRDPNDAVMKNRIKVLGIDPDSEGRKMTLILDSPKPGSRGYFVGGSWQ